MNTEMPVQAFGFPSGIGGGGSCTSDAPRVLVANGLLEELRAHGRRVAYEDLSLAFSSLVRPVARMQRGGKARCGGNHLLRIRDTLRYAYVSASRVHTNDEVPLFIGGDHTLAAATLLASLRKYGDDLRVLYFDQHGDAHDHTSTPSGNAHGMPLALAMGYGEKRLLHGGNLTTGEINLASAQILHIGADPDSVEQAERDFFDSHNVNVVTIHEMRARGMESVAAEIKKFAAGHPLHVSFDIDVTDAPGTGYPAVCGMTLTEALFLVNATRRAGRVIAVDMVEYCVAKDEPDVDGASWVTMNYIKKILSTLIA